MQPESETIYALSSGATRAGVAVVRLSGPRSMHALGLLAGPTPAARHATLRAIKDPHSGEVIDHGLILAFPAPHSFTGEDSAELHLHGSLGVVRVILSILSRIDGLRLAEPGEFTRRAWLAGKLDLLEVEALGDLLSSETELQRRLAVQGSARFRDVAVQWRSNLLDLRARIEAEIDFADEGDVIATLDSVTQQDILAVARGMTTVLASSGVGERVRRGFRVAVLGPPNAGKSTLVNALAARDVMITSPVPGTTRDAVEVLIDLEGLPVVFTDTAGMRESDDPLEREGIRRSHEVSLAADLVLWLSPADLPIAAPDSRFVPVTTKMDLGVAFGPSPLNLEVSVVTGQGVNALVEFIRRQALDGADDLGSLVILSHERQRERVSQCIASLVLAASSGSATLDMRAEDLRQACMQIEALIGRVQTDDILDVIFARFCVGK